MNFKISEKSQTKNSMYYMYPVIRNIHNRKIFSKSMVHLLNKQIKQHLKMWSLLFLGLFAVFNFKNACRRNDMDVYYSIICNSRIQEIL